MRRAAVAIAGLISVALAVPGEGAGSKRALPYFASIGASRARMRTGPARTYPVSWLYQRADLPVKVVATFKEWRKIQDPDGTEGWMQATLLREQRTAIVRGTEPVEMHEAASEGARLLWRAAPGVVGRVDQCGYGWCRLDVSGRAGFVRIDRLWGVGDAETLP